jgi:hypothetical protein
VGCKGAILKETACASGAHVTHSMTLLLNSGAAPRLLSSVGSDTAVTFVTAAQQCSARLTLSVALTLTGTTTPCGNSSSGNLRASCAGPALLPIARMAVRGVLLSSTDGATPAADSTSASLHGTARQDQLMTVNWSLLALYERLSKQLLLQHETTTQILRSTPQASAQTIQTHSLVRVPVRPCDLQAVEAVQRALPPAGGHPGSIVKRVSCGSSAAAGAVDEHKRRWGPRVGVACRGGHECVCWVQDSYMSSYRLSTNTQTHLWLCPTSLRLSHPQQAGPPPCRRGVRAQAVLPSSCALQMLLQQPAEPWQTGGG